MALSGVREICLDTCLNTNGTFYSICNSFHLSSFCRQPRSVVVSMQHSCAGNPGLILGQGKDIHGNIALNEDNDLVRENTHTNIYQKNLILLLK